MKSNVVKILIGVIFLSGGTIMAEIPPMIDYQGVLTDTLGKPVKDGIYTVRFRILSDSIAGNILWETAGFVPIQMQSGFFRHTLGSTNTLPDSLGSYSGLWLEVTGDYSIRIIPRANLALFSFPNDHSSLLERLISLFRKHWYIALVISGILIGSIIPAGAKVFRFFRDRHKKKEIYKDLHPFYTPLEIKEATRYYVQTKCQNISPSQEEEPDQSHAFATKQKLIPFFLNQAFKFKGIDQRFYIILADSGMGKTTFLINLYLKYAIKTRGREYKIRLMPLGMLDIDSKIDEIKSFSRSKTILLLDAFDEDIEAVKDYKKRLQNLIEKVSDFRIVVITCRTQFFPSEKDEPKETNLMKFGTDKGWHEFHKLYISPFDNDDIKRYLRKKIRMYKIIKRRRIQNIVRQSHYLMVRPMLLNYIDQLDLSKIDYNYSINIYEELINRWIEREAARQPKSSKKEDKYKIEQKDISKFKSDLYAFSRAIAIDTHVNRLNRGGIFIEESELKQLAKRYDINLSTLEMESRSLLNRNASGQYKLAHRSIQEYYLAKEMYTNNNMIIQNTAGYDQFRVFCREFLYRKLQSRKDGQIIFSRKALNANGDGLNILGIYMEQSNPVTKISIIGFPQDINSILHYISIVFSDLKDLKIGLSEYLNLNLLKLFKNLNCLEFVPMYSEAPVFRAEILKDMPALQFLRFVGTINTDISIEFMGIAYNLSEVEFEAGTKEIEMIKHDPSKLRIMTKVSN